MDSTDDIDLAEIRRFLEAMTFPASAIPVREVVDQYGCVWMYRGDEVVGWRALEGEDDDSLPREFIDGSGIFGPEYFET